MRRAARRLNFLIEENLCRDLEAMIPAGKRSKVVNDALRRELELIRRRDVVEKILANGTKGRRLSTGEIVDSLSTDRQEH